MNYHRASRLFIATLLLLDSTLAHAGPWEALSQGAAKVGRHEKCEKVDSEKANLVLSEIVGSCEVNNGNKLKKWINQFDRKSSAEMAENQFFRALALEYAPELICGADLAARVSTDTEYQDDIIYKLQEIRRLSQLQLEFKFACPRDMSLVVGSAEFTKICLRKNQIRVAIENLEAKIPLSNADPINKLITQVKTAGIATEGPRDPVALGSAIRSAYFQASRKLRAQGLSLKNTAEKGGAHFKRSTRRTLASDPLLISRVIEKSRGEKNLIALACSVDTRYGSGADALDKDILLGTLLVGTGLTAAAGFAAKTAQTIATVNAARSVGLSISFAKTLQLGAGVMDVMAAASAINKACPSDESMKYTSGNGKACVNTPNFEDIKYGNCQLAWMMGALGVIAPIATAELQIRSASSSLKAFRSANALANPIKNSTLKQLVAAKNPVQKLFVKDAPFYAYKITSNKFEDIPEPIRKVLGSVDKTKYNSKYLQENMGSVISLQMKGDAPDFYPVGLSSFTEKYKVSTVAQMTTKNNDYLSKVSQHIGSIAQSKDPNLMVIVGTKKVPMVRLSEIMDIKEELAIESAWGIQVKPANLDAFISLDPDGNYYLINIDGRGLPINYAPAK
ncbi:MAG: hypothetical protein V4736_13210 [Bdellovibrionota bacterium]